MGYSVYWANKRWQGYGVLAFCDFKDCTKEINRGMGFQNENDIQEVDEDGEIVKSSPPNTFCCNDHSYSDPDEDCEINLNKEHPKWFKHVLTDNSWEQWRKENPETAGKYRNQLKKAGE